MHSKILCRQSLNLRSPSSPFLQITENLIEEEAESLQVRLECGHQKNKTLEITEQKACELIDTQVASLEPSWLQNRSDYILQLLPEYYMESLTRRRSRSLSVLPAFETLPPVERLHLTSLLQILLQLHIVCFIIFGCFLEDLLLLRDRKRVHLEWRRGREHLGRAR